MAGRARRAIGSLVLTVYLCGYIALAAVGGAYTAEAHPVLQILYFAVAGVIWVIPLRGLFAWMRGTTAGVTPRSAASASASRGTPPQAGP